MSLLIRIVHWVRQGGEEAMQTKLKKLSLLLRIQLSVKGGMKWKVGVTLGPTC